MKYLFILLLMPCWCMAQVFIEGKNRDTIVVNGDTSKYYGTGERYKRKKADTVKAEITVRPFCECNCPYHSGNHGWIENGFKVKTSDGFVYFLDSFKFIIDPNRIIKTEIKDWDRPGRVYYY